jgi:hypothetical protein
MLAILAPAALQAATWTVDNNIAMPADFRGVQEAVDAAADGDTILVQGSGSTYGGIVKLSKRLKIYGPGYFLKENTIPGPLFDATISVDLSPGASGSRLEGLIISNLTSLPANDACNNLSIVRCLGYTGGWVLYGNGHFISQCYHPVGMVQFLGNLNIISNSCLNLYIDSLTSGSTVDHCVIIIPSAESTNNFGSGNTVINSIITRTSPTNYIAGYIGNCLVMQGSTLPTGNGNLTGGIAGNIFQQPSDPPFGDPTANDTGFRLKAGSVAIGAGTNGTDLGMFGGATPYVPGGIPAIPRITSLTLPVVVPDSTGLTFEVKAEARN